MNKPEPFQESRRSSLVPRAITVDIDTGGEPRSCPGETVVVNLHGALINSSCDLSLGESITVHVYLTGKSAKARVVNIAAADNSQYGIELTEAKNIWGVSLPPSDWQEEQHH
jgi:hypothetical protein